MARWRDFGHGDTVATHTILSFLFFFSTVRSTYVCPHRQLDSANTMYLIPDRPQGRVGINSFTLPYRARGTPLRCRNHTHTHTPPTSLLCTHLRHTYFSVIQLGIRKRNSLLSWLLLPAYLGFLITMLYSEHSFLKTRHPHPIQVSQIPRLSIWSPQLQ